jgi:hypothetical protein
MLFSGLDYTMAMIDDNYDTLLSRFHFSLYIGCGRVATGFIVFCLSQY